MEKTSKNTVKLLSTGEIVEIYFRFANGIGYVTDNGIKFVPNGEFEENRGLTMKQYLVHISITDGENTVENDFYMDSENFTAAVEDLEQTLDVCLQ